jgi:hypothetical protein
MIRMRIDELRNLGIKFAIPQSLNSKIERLAPPTAGLIPGF